MSSLLREMSSRASRTSSLLHNCKRLRTRHIHIPRPLPYPIEGGLGKFLPPEALRTFEEYQDGLLQRLNDELRNTKVESQSSVAQTALNYAEQKERTLAFNYAVLAWNTSFFLDNLTPPPPPPPPEEEGGEEETQINHQNKVSSELLIKIRNHYGDFPRLKSSFSAAAMGMFTNGWVWMITDPQGNLGILPTYGPSTLLIRSRMNMANKSTLFRENDLDSKDSTPPATPPNGSTTTPASPPGVPLPPGVGPTSPISGLSSRPFGASGSTLDPHGRSYSFAHILEDIIRPKKDFSDGEDDYGDDARGVKTPPHKVLTAGDSLYPLFCLPTYEHAWMSAGFGVWGKEQWIREFWTVLDWRKVSRTYDDVLNRRI